MSDPAQFREDAYEAFRLYPAWGTIVGHLSRSEPAEADPHDIYGSICGTDQDRLAALLYAHSYAETMQDAHALLFELAQMARSGCRPRFARELDLDLGEGWS